MKIIPRPSTPCHSPGVPQDSNSSTLIAFPLWHFTRTNLELPSPPRSFVLVPGKAEAGASEILGLEIASKTNPSKTYFRAGSGVSNPPGANK
jgi:hypothetical protein